jgi:hypothetical protein
MKRPAEERALTESELMQSAPVEDSWHGWPPQTWNGRTWRYIEPALLLVRQAHELQRLRRLLIGMQERAAKPRRRITPEQRRRPCGLMARNNS